MNIDNYQTNNFYDEYFIKSNEPRKGPSILLDRIKSLGIKELKKNHVRRMHNLDIKTDLKKTIKKFISSVDSKQADDIKENLKLVYKKLDKAAKRNIIQKNTASRRKSRYSKLATAANS